MTQRRRADRAAARRPAPPARERLLARPPRAGQGRARAAARAPRSVRRRAVAGARRDAPRLSRGARPAQRADRARARGPRVARRRSAPVESRRWPSAGVALAADRARGRRADRGAVSPRTPRELGLDGDVRVAYRAALARRPTPSELAAEIAAALDADLARGHTTRGPHRDDLVDRARRPRAARYGSQGEQRLALLALLLAERDALAAERDRAAAAAARRRDERARRARRERLAAELRRGGQAVVTATEREHVPGGTEAAGRRRRRRLSRCHEARRAPRPLADALGPFTAALEPASPLARAQGCWEQVVGPAIAAHASRSASVAGSCRWPATEAVWAAEVDLLGPSLVDALNTAIGTSALRSVRARNRPPTGRLRAPHFWRCVR